MSGAYEQFSIHSDLCELDRLFEFLESFCTGHGLTAQTRHRLSLVAEELAVNSIEHGYRGRRDGRIHISLKRELRQLEVLVRDDCPRFNPFAEAPNPDTSATIEDRPIGGLGVHFIRSLTVAVHYRFENGQNVVGATLALEN